jgi:phage terminase large subunit-like protein
MARLKQINIKRREYMVIGTHKILSRFSQDTTVSIDGKVTKQVNSNKTLGVIIDENLCWDKQIENISKKVSNGVGMLRRVKPFVSIGTLTYLYQALVQPHFDYCSIWFGVTVAKP